MDYRSGCIGRVFWARLDDGEDLGECLQDLARRETIGQALVLVLGALGQARVVVGPRETVIPPDPVWTAFTGGREILGVGTLVDSPEGPSLHMHIGAGRGEEPTVVGCLRAESQVYLLVEAVILEVTHMSARREPDEKTGLNLLTFK